MESSSTRFRPRVPSPDPVVAVTLQVLPLPVTLPTDPPVTESVRARAKSPASTPVTGSLNVTVHETLPAFVGLAAPTRRLMEETVGGVASRTTLIELLAAL